MFKCKRCDGEFRDGVQCSVCQDHFDFPCSGITEGGYRKLGDRQKKWKCASCKSVSSGTASPRLPPSNDAGLTPLASPTPKDLESIRQELKLVASQLASLPGIVADIKSIKTNQQDLKTIKSELTDVKSSVDFVHQAVEVLTNKVAQVDCEVQGLLKTKDEVKNLHERIDKLERAALDNEQRSRLNNIEIKGVPVSPAENLFSIVSKIGDHIKCPISKEQINYVARVPMRHDKSKKNIIVSVHNRYLKDDFVAGAKKSTLVSGDLNLQDGDRIFVNDHLTLENKHLLNKTKELSKERGYAFTWVKGCKIFVSKNTTSPAVSIKSESDLKKLLL